MAHLRRLVLNNNKFSGNLNDFSEAIPRHSKLQWLNVAENQFSGPLFAPALIRLAVFSSMRDAFQTEYDRLAEHVFDASGNKLIGDIGTEILQVQSSSHPMYRACSVRKMNTVLFMKVECIQIQRVVCSLCARSLSQSVKSVSVVLSKRKHSGIRGAGAGGGQHPRGLT